ncbi:MAG: hypothetical protein ABII74_05425 [Elusimicrobiota bacterium]
MLTKEKSKETLMNIHKTALVHPDAVIGEDVEIGPFSIIGGEVKIGKNTRIGAHVVIEGISEIGENCRIFTGAIIGNFPQDLKYKGGKNESCDRQQQCYPRICND